MTIHMFAIAIILIRTSRAHLNNLGVSVVTLNQRIVVLGKDNNEDRSIEDKISVII